MPPVLFYPPIPYFEQPSLPLFGDFKIHAFGVLVAIGIVLGARVTLRRAAMLGLDTGILSDLIVWTVGTGFVVGHVFEIVFYETHKLSTDPYILFKLWAGLSSTGGFIGAAIGCGLFCWRKGIKFFEYGDPIAYGLPLGWFFGRMGCSVAHDHPGMKTDFLWLAVDYPDGPRFDLGFLEMIFTVFLMSGVFLSTIPKTLPDGKKQPRVYPPGTFLAVICIAYAPVRFAMDFLRAPPTQGGDVRYLGLTPAQWAMFGLLALGIGIAWEARRRAKAGRLYKPVFAAVGDGDKEGGDSPEKKKDASGESESAPESKSEGDGESKKPGKRPHKERKAKSS
ncbi:MAG: prolipoprotein diacylglyceryl transferase [Deltaproteobacteria bacterium]|nr:prolipoprotein diacylglyceryl transferase [Deltaproteobacteria bacterium]